MFYLIDIFFVLAYFSLFVGNVKQNQSITLLRINA